MPRNISASNLAALEGRRLVLRDFVWFVARDREDGSPVTEGLWSDVGDVSAPIVDPDSGIDVDRDWRGSGTLVAIDDIPITANLTVREVGISLSQILDRVNQLVRDYDVQQAAVQIFRGLFDPSTRQMVDAAECRFAGFVDRLEIKTPREGEDGGVQLTCASHTVEMTRSNPDSRSDASQKRRNGVDGFYQDASTVEEWEVFWGSQKGKVPTQPRKKFLGIF